MTVRTDYLNPDQTIEHFDLAEHNVVPLVDAMKRMAFSSRDLARAADIFDMMVRDREAGVILCLAGSLISAGLKKVIVQMLENNMIDAIVSTGANIVDQDFFEALGYKHYIADDRFKSGMYDGELRDLHIDRIYDTFIDEDQLKECDFTIKVIADQIEPGAYSSRQFIMEMAKWLIAEGKGEGSIVRTAYEKGVPIFCPAFSDCSAGFGLVAHQAERESTGQAIVRIDSVQDFYEITKIKLENPETGIFMIGGGVPKNFVQDIVVCAEVLGHDAPMHKYAIQITIADVRDGALSSSTLKEASSWGKVDLAYEQMVYSEATLAMPLIAGYALHKGAAKDRNARRFNDIIDRVAVKA